MQKRSFWQGKWVFNDSFEMQSHERPDIPGDVLINNNEDNNLNIVSRKCIIEHA